ncbi:VQ motif-containing protein 4 [Lotus japonicus]|uniref:VQ motif-containing protein 4 n=1 Tax=Lotus japonicus TaxID=34305 RepID=UPI00258750CF|nr:VQ motif-containing protein 4 [Lotus japonicus]
MDSKSPRTNNNHHHHHLLPSPRSSSSSSSTSNNGGAIPSPPSPSPYPPKPITRSDSANPYPTTFVQADTSSFKQVVQMLTGSTETAKQASSEVLAGTAVPPNKSHHHHNHNHHNHHHIPPIKTIPRKQNHQQHQSGFKLYERRNSLKNLKLNPLLPVFSSPHHSAGSAGFSPRKPEILSPSILDFPALVLSPVTPLLPDPFNRAAAGNLHRCGNSSPSLNTEAEEKAIKEKGFFLHPSPSTTPRDPEPRLLPLFPTTSPRASGSSSSS